MAWEQNSTASVPYYVHKERRGDRVVSRYCGTGQIGADFDTIDRLFRTARADCGRVAHLFMAKLRALHAANEHACRALGAEVTTVLTAAGFHRPSRHPWRKSGRARANSAPIQDTAFELLASLEPALTQRVADCRRHASAIEDLYDSLSPRARSKTALRLYNRCRKRATNRIEAAEKSLLTIQNLALDDHLNAN